VSDSFDASVLCLSSRSDVTGDEDTTRWLQPCASIAATLAFAWFAYRPSGASQLLSMCACPVALLIGVGAPIVLRRFGRRDVIALAAIVGSPFLGAFVGRAVRHADFELRVRPRYEALIARVEHGSVSVDEAQSTWPTDVRDIAYGVRSTRTPAGERCFVFFWGGGFPVKHTVFMHGTPAACARDQSGFRLEPLGDDWSMGSD
jgi:hypothetical protein